MADIKDLLNDIIHDDDAVNGDVVKKDNIPMSNNAVFNKADFREKLSLNVLKDIISAMMHDETKDLDGMIDASIKRHIDTNYNGSCYCYLTRSCDALGSPLLGSIIQEINNKVEEVAEQVRLTNNCACVNEADLKTVELLEASDQDTYQEFRNKLRDKVSRDIVEEVSEVITKGADIPKFENIDNSIKKSNENKDEAIKEEPENSPSDVNTESKILRMCGSIIQESVLKHEQMSTEEGLNQAIVEYCIVQMDRLFKQNSNIDGYSRYLK